MGFKNHITKKKYREISKFITDIKELINTVSENWRRSFYREKIPDLMEKINFFQTRYNIPENLRVDTSNITNIFEIGSKTEQREVSERLLDILSRIGKKPKEERKSNDLKPEIKKETYRVDYANFTENPINNLKDLLEGLINIEQYFTEDKFSEKNFTDWPIPIIGRTITIYKKDFKWIILCLILGFAIGLYSGFEIFFNP